MEVNQFLAGFTYGDGITDYVIELKRVISEMGFPSNIYAVKVDTYMKNLKTNRAIRYTEYEPCLDSGRNVAILHFSIGENLNTFVERLPDRKVLIYHNVTPARFFESFDEDVSMQLESGREDISSYVDVPDVSVGVSEYNCKELKRYGFRNVRLLHPPAFYLSRFSSVSDREVLGKYKDGNANILFVGRVAPNKRIEDLIKVLYVCRKKLHMNIRLIVVGSYNLWEKYYSFLRKLISRLGLGGDVVFTDKVKNHELVSYYRIADVYLSMSEHEGFGVPLIEAMMFGVPVLAYGVTGVPYTVGYGGILFDKKDFYEIAEVIKEVVSDSELRSTLVEAGRQRAEDFSKEKWDKEAKEVIGEIIKKWGR